MRDLLEKTRELTRFIQRFPGKVPDFEAIAKVLGHVLGANVYLVGRRGKILGYGLLDTTPCAHIEEVLLYSERFPETYNQELLAVTETRANWEREDNSCLFCPAQDCPLPRRMLTVVPVFGWGERLGTIVATKGGKEEFGLSDLVLAEHGATIVGAEILRLKMERVEEDMKRRATVQIALGALSFSEMGALEHVFSRLDGYEGLLVASRIADEAGITRSVIVNALRKLESAGVIKTKSLGMKGTYIRVLNENLLEELKKIRWSRRPSSS